MWYTASRGAKTQQSNQLCNQARQPGIRYDTGRCCGHASKVCCLEESILFPSLMWEAALHTNITDRLLPQSCGELIKASAVAMSHRRMSHSSDQDIIIALHINHMHSIQHSRLFSICRRQCMGISSQAMPSVMHGAWLNPGYGVFWEGVHGHSQSQWVP